MSCLGARPRFSSPHALKIFGLPADSAAECCLVLESDRVLFDFASILSQILLAPELQNQSSGRSPLLRSAPKNRSGLSCFAERGYAYSRSSRCMSYPFRYDSLTYVRTFASLAGGCRGSLRCGGALLSPLVLRLPLR